VEWAAYCLTYSDKTKRLNQNNMGLLDFFKRGKEQPIEQRPATKPAENVHRPGQPASAGTGPQQTTRDYTIQPGDSLSKIAKRYYGNAGEWQKIYQANKDKIKDPNMIYPGQKIIIP
jgi:nucleoid-associated protein YgaU